MSKSLFAALTIKKLNPALFVVARAETETWHPPTLEFQLEEIVVPVTSPCSGLMLCDSGLWGQPGVIGVTIKRAEEKIEAGDGIIAWAEAPQLKELERRIQSGHG